MRPYRITLDEYKRHAASHPWIGETKDKIEHPVCPRCERIALRGTGVRGSWGKERIATCPACGWRGRATTTLREYIHEELYRR